jgi:hypothetical protein
MLNFPIRFKKISPSILNAQTKKALKIGLVVLTGAVLILAALFFLLRNVVLNRMIDNKIVTYLGNHQGAVLRIDAARFSGFDRIVFEKIRLQSADKTIAIALGSWSGFPSGTCSWGGCGSNISS